MKFRIFSMLAASIASMSAGAASAQGTMANIIGNTIANASAAAQADADFARCVSGKNGLSDADAREADGPVQASLAKYWATVRTTDNVQVGSLFDSSGKATWVANGVDIRVHRQDITDPFARTTGNTLVEKPITLVRSNNWRTARGIWEITNLSGERVGYYRIDFTQTSGWRPLKLELLPADTPVPTVTPYCYQPGDIESFYETATAIPESKITKTAKKAVAVATCVQGPDCTDKWARAQLWIQENRAFALIRNTDKLLLTFGPVYADLDLTYVVTLDPPNPDGRQTIRFRAWCGNMIMCEPTPAKAQQAFVTALQQPPTVTAQASM